MTQPPSLLLDMDTRRQVWQRVITVIEDYIANINTARVAPELAVETVRSLVQQIDFREPLDATQAIDLVVDGLWQYQVHTPHPRYFGLFNPAPTFMGMAADALVAAFNPQLAAWSHSPFAVEVEQQLVRAFGTRFGYMEAQVDGIFTSGGAEANHTALLCALTHTFPEFARHGLRALNAQPVFYVSAQSHHSFIKAARFCGLGTDAVRSVPTDSGFAMDVAALRSQIACDRETGGAPFMVVATAGTTSGGIIEPIEVIGQIAVEENLWFHIDAAWGGLAILVPELCHLLRGVESADSITFDAHKKLSVPMAAGMLFTRHPAILNQTCRVTTDYMPRNAADWDITDPYTHSMQWSRRFIGLKVFLSLAVAGWDGYAHTIRHQVAMGDLLRRELQASNWDIVNATPLPVVCFVDSTHPQGRTAAYLDAIAQNIVASGDAWLSTTRLDAVTPVLRACITNYRTSAEDVQTLVKLLNQVRLKPI